MPIYEYRCESCGSELERIQKVSEPALTDCPGCGKAALVKLISASGFRLKGGGWYETDFKTGKKKNVLEGASSSSGSSPDGGGKSDGASKSDSAAKSSDGSSSGKAAAAS